MSSFRRRFYPAADAAGWLGPVIGLAALVVLALLVTAPAAGDPGDAASGTLSRTSDGKLQLTVKNDGSTTLHYLRFDVKAGYQPVSPTMSGGSCGPGSSANQLFCSGFSLDAEETLVVSFATSPNSYPDDGGGTLHVSSGGSNDQVSSVSGPGPPQSGGPCRVKFTKELLTEGTVHARRLGENEFAAEYGAGTRHYAVRLYIQGSPCPDIELRDLLPATFTLEDSSVFEVNGPTVAHVEQSSDNPRDLVLKVAGSKLAGTQSHSVTWYIDGHFSAVKDSTNQARRTAPATNDQLTPDSDLVSNTALVHVVAKDELWSVKASATGVSGKVREIGVGGSSLRALAAAGDRSRALSKPKLVQIAIRRLGGKHPRRCVWLRDRRAHFKRTRRVHGVCTPIWLKARGTFHWRLRFLRRLPRGRYELVGRITDAAGIRSVPARGRFRIR